MLFSKLVSAAVVSCLAAQSAALAYGGKPNQVIKPYKRAPLQDIVTWDEHSLFVRGKRVLFYSGEFHPFRYESFLSRSSGTPYTCTKLILEAYRLPVPSLWLDVFQKIKALGYDGVSFYTDWALLEGQPGNFTAEG
ncbi:hypothetical protein B0A49_00503, partial [Cryomyces minteri]